MRNDSHLPAWQRLREDQDEERFPFAGNGCHIDLVIADQLIDDFAFSNRANDDHVWSKVVFVVRDCCSVVRNAFDVRLQIVGRTNNTWEVS